MPLLLAFVVASRLTLRLSRRRSLRSTFCVLTHQGSRLETVQSCEGMAILAYVSVRRKLLSYRTMGRSGSTIIHKLQT